MYIYMYIYIWLYMYIYIYVFLIISLVFRLDSPFLVAKWNNISQKSSTPGDHLLCTAAYRRSRLELPQTVYWVHVKYSAKIHKNTKRYYRIFPKLDPVYSSLFRISVQRTDMIRSSPSAFLLFFLLNPGWNPRKNQKWDIPSEITRPILQKPCNWAELSPYQHPDSLGFQHQESTNTTELRIRSWGQWAHGSSYSAVFPFFWYSTPIPQTVKDPQYMVPKMSPVDPIRNTCF